MFPSKNIKITITDISTNYSAAPGYTEAVKAFYERLISIQMTIHQLFFVDKALSNIHIIILYTPF